MNKICMGDMFSASKKVRKSTDSVWKRSKYFIIYSENEFDYIAYNEIQKTIHLAKGFMLKIWEDGLVIKIENEEDKAKLLLL